MIFNLFKSKPTLKELIPEEFVDIHSHVLPGIDDGAKNVEESLLLISEMKKLGFSKLICTPHIYPGLYDNDINSINNSFDLIKNSNIRIEFSAEYLIGDYLINLIKSKNILTIKGKYILVEFSYLNKPVNYKNIIFELIHNGYIPVLAHPERYRFLHNDFSNYSELIRIGCKFQLNLFSTIGYYGDDVRKMSDKLLKNNMIEFVGSDIHSVKQISNFDKMVQINNLRELSRIINNNKLLD